MKRPDGLTPALLLVADHERALYTAADFCRIRQLVHDRSGISLGDFKRSMVSHRLARRLRAHGLTRFDRYLDLVETDTSEWDACIEAITADLTSFFREDQHFAIIADYVKRRHLPKLRIWCAAASTGEEPYSIAMTMIEAYGSDRPPVEIIASDIDPEALAHAQRGVYKVERMAPVSGRRRARFFQPGDGPNAGYVRVGPALRTLIDYRRINLEDAAWQMPGGLDIIMCRNVLMYFDHALQRKIVHRFGALLADDGLLVTGQSETIAYAADAFTSLGQTVYRPMPRSQLVAGRA